MAAVYRARIASFRCTVQHQGVGLLGTPSLGNQTGKVGCLRPVALMAPGLRSRTLAWWSVYVRTGLGRGPRRANRTPAQRALPWGRVRRGAPAYPATRSAPHRDCGLSVCWVGAVRGRPRPRAAAHTSLRTTRRSRSAPHRRPAFACPSVGTVRTRPRTRSTPRGTTMRSRAAPHSITGLAGCRVGTVRAHARTRAAAPGTRSRGL